MPLLRNTKSLVRNRCGGQSPSGSPRYVRPRYGHSPSRYVSPRYVRPRDGHSPSRYVSCTARYAIPRPMASWNIPGLCISLPAYSCYVACYIPYYELSEFMIKHVSTRLR